MEKITKENAVQNYFESVLKNSWTWQKMTDGERKTFQDFVFPFVDRYAKGNVEERENSLFAAYHAYLYGIGFCGYGWRSDGEDTF